MNEAPEYPGLLCYEKGPCHTHVIRFCYDFSKEKKENK